MINFDLPSTHTRRFINISKSDINPNEIVISAGDATENRGQLPLWSEIYAEAPDRIIWIRHSDQDRDHILVQQGSRGGPVKLPLRDEACIDGVFCGSEILVDISGLSHRVWTPIIKSLHARGVQTRVLYAEPKSYKLHPSPASATVFDLSSDFAGLEPLPGLARLSGPRDETKCLFIAMLGFEGSRPERLAVQVDPPPKVIPVVGVPGFQLEYPTFTVACNRVFLDDYKAHAEVRIARASCPFEAYQELLNIRRDYPDHYMYLAPIGTKPHALGTILFAIANPDNTEVMFDHPIRKPGRTSGVGVIHIYDFGKFDVL